MGLEGTGKVVEANGEDIQSWLGKRVSFVQSGSGTWAEFAVANAAMVFEIDQDLDLTSAASGIVNPLTVEGFLDVYNKTKGKRGIIHTAAGSALGRMLNKRCQTLDIPLLNIVRREEHAEVLKSEGAKHVIVTKAGWEAEYTAAIKGHGFNIFFDALGGGSVLETLIAGLQSNSWVYVYGVLESKPFQLKVALDLCKGVFVSGFLLFQWFGTLTEEEKADIRKGYAKLLKGELSTKCHKVLKFEQIEEALELSVSKASEGKITIVPQ